MAVGKQISILVNGHDLACALKTFEPLSQADEQDATVLCHDARSWESGFINGELTASGIWKHNPTLSDQIHEVMVSAMQEREEMVVTASFGEIVIGDPAIMVNPVAKKYAIIVPNGEIIAVDVAFRSNNGIQAGLWHSNSQLNSGATNGSSIDNGAASSNGGLFHGHLHNDDADIVQLILQHSTNDSVWADLVSIANLAGAFASGQYSVLANFADDEDIVFSGVTFTAKDTPVGATEFQRGTGATGDDTDLGISIDNLVTMLNASANPAINVATYSDNHTSTNKDATEIYVTYDTLGAAGNAYTLGTDTANIDRSGSTLSGGDGGEAKRGQSVAIAKGVTINRYTRTRAVLTGGDSVLVSSAFARF